MLGYNKSYTTLAFNCTLKNSKRTLSMSGINRRHRKNNIEND